MSSPATSPATSVWVLVWAPETPSCLEVVCCPGTLPLAVPSSPVLLWGDQDGTWEAGMSSLLHGIPEALSYSPSFLPLRGEYSDLTSFSYFFPSDVDYHYGCSRLPCSVREREGAERVSEDSPRCPSLSSTVVCERDRPPCDGRGASVATFSVISSLSCPSQMASH